MKDAKNHNNVIQLVKGGAEPKDAPTSPEQLLGFMTSLVEHEKAAQSRPSVSSLSQLGSLKGTLKIDMEKQNSETVKGNVEAFPREAEVVKRTVKD